MKASIRPLLVSDWEAVQAIYLEGIATGNATFQTTAPVWEAWDSGHLQACRYVAFFGDAVVGWAALSAISSRPVYQGVAEVSIYVAREARALGVGKTLMGQLVTVAEHLGFWTLQSGIFPENRASIALHQQAGFREVGYREKIGQLNGVWRDVILMERRSTLI